MPWNCLCSSKEKRKLEISAPIINIEDSSNQQLVSSLKPRPFLIPASTTKTTKYLSNNNNEKISDKSSILKNQQQNLNGHNKKSKKSNITTTVSSSIVTETPASDTLLGSRKKLKKQKKLKNDEKNLLKQKQKEQKLFTKTNNNNGIGIDSNEKITKQLANVKFSFDKSTASINTTDTIESCENKPNVCINAPSCYDNINDEKVQSDSPVFLLCTTNNAATTTAASVDKNKINENVSNVDRIQEKQKEQQQELPQQKQKERMQEIINENAGNYDEIPFVENENFIAQSYYDENSSEQQMQQQHINNQVKNDNCTDTTIPYIDEELHLLIQKNTENLLPEYNKNIVVDDHNARFITIHPQNIGSFQTITNAIIPTTNMPNAPNHHNPKVSLNLLRDEQTENYYFDNQISNFELNNNTVKRKDAGKYIITSSINNKTNTDPLLTKDILPATTTVLNQHRIPVEHDFQSWKVIKGKLCQLCHESLLKKPSCVLKCRSCDLICHNWCATKMVSGFCIS